MDQAASDEREVRAARNQALFRAVNEKLNEINTVFAAITETLTIACECADVGCVETLEMEKGAYEAVRSNPRTFAVLPGHVYPDVEDVVAENARYTIVEKRAKAGVVASEVAGENVPR